MKHLQINKTSTIINTILISVLILLFTFCSPNRQQKKNEIFVIDHEKILTSRELLKFDQLFRNHEKLTGNEIVLVSTNNYGGDHNILNYSVNLGNKLGVGKTAKDNGIMIVISKKNRETRISTGYGLEDLLKDEIAKKIIDSLMIPKFKEGKYFDGLWAGSNAIVDLLEKPANLIR